MTERQKQILKCGVEMRQKQEARAFELFKATYRYGGHVFKSFTDARTFRRGRDCGPNLEFNVDLQ